MSRNKMFLILALIQLLVNGLAAYSGFRTGRDKANDEIIVIANEIYKHAITCREKLIQCESRF